VIGDSSSKVNNTSNVVIGPNNKQFEYILILQPSKMSF